MARAQVLVAVLLGLAVCCSCNRAPPYHFFYPPQRGLVVPILRRPPPFRAAAPEVAQTVYVVVEDAAGGGGPNYDEERHLLDAIPSLLEMLSAGGAGDAKQRPYGISGGVFTPNSAGGGGAFPPTSAGNAYHQTSGGGGAFPTTSGDGGAFHQTSGGGGAFPTASGDGGAFHQTSGDGGAFYPTSGGGGSTFHPISGGDGTTTTKTPAFLDDIEPQFDKDAWHQDETGDVDRQNGADSPAPVPDEAAAEYGSSPSSQLEYPKESYDTPEDYPDDNPPIDVRSSFASSQSRPRVNPKDLASS